METIQVLMVIAVFVLAGSVKGVTGMGLPSVAVSLLGLWMPAAQAATLLDGDRRPSRPQARHELPQVRPTALGHVGGERGHDVTAFAPGLGGTVPANSANCWLGGVLVGYGLWGLWRPVLPDLSGRGRWVGAAAGAATGLVTALTAVFTVPWVPYLQSLRLDKDAMVQAQGLSFTVATLALAVRLQASPQVEWWSISEAVAVCGALAGAFAGLKVGEVLRGGLAGPAFQKALFLVFIALGAVNLVRAG